MPLTEVCIADSNKNPGLACASAQGLPAEFQKHCRFYGFEILAIASGLAFLRDKFGEVIITLPRNPAGVEYLKLFTAVRGRSVRGRFGEAAAAFPMKRLATPDMLMTWEEYNAKWDGRERRDPTEVAE